MSRTNKGWFSKPERIFSKLKETNTRKSNIHGQGYDKVIHREGIQTAKEDA